MLKIKIGGKTEKGKGYEKGKNKNQIKSS